MRPELTFYGLPLMETAHVEGNKTGKLNETKVIKIYNFSGIKHAPSKLIALNRFIKLAFLGFSSNYDTSGDNPYLKR